MKIPNKPAWLVPIKTALKILWLNKIFKCKHSLEHESYDRTKKNADDGCSFVIWLSDYSWFLNILLQMAKLEEAPESVIRWLQYKLDEVYTKAESGHTNYSIQINYGEKDDNIRDS